MELEWAEGQTARVTWTEHDDPQAPVIVIWPAFGTPATFYRHLTPALRSAGLASLVVEYPGRQTPDGVGRHSEYGYDDLATKVHTAVMRHVRAARPDARVVLLGHSLGGHVSLFAAALAERGGPGDDDAATRPDAVVLAASANPYWRGYGWAGFPRSFVGTAAMAAISRGVGYWPGDRLKFWGRQSRVLVTDWSRIARTGRVLPRGASRDYEQALRDFDGEVLAISLPDDRLAPVPALERLLGLVPKARVTRWHAPVRVGHIQWVRRNADIVPIIAEWVHRLPARV